MKKILVVNDFPIFPVVHGGKVRIFNIYKNISSKFQVTYLCLGEKPRITYNAISENFQEISVPKTFFYKVITAIANLFFRSSVDDFIALFFASSNRMFKRIIQKELGECDIIIFSHPYMYSAVRPYIRNQLVIYEAHNVEYALKKAILPDRLLKNVMLQRLKEQSQDLLQRCDLCFAMSEDDKKTFSQFYDVNLSKICIAPNGVDIDFYSDIFRTRMSRREKVIPVPLILFLGSGHPPNVKAAFQIIRNIAPKLPHMYFLIAGSVCWMIRNEQQGTNVGLAYLITEEEKRELFRVTDVAINPMMSGSGTNLKMLDYMAAGIPVVSTAVGARGINIQNRVHAIICDIEAFPDEISDLIDNPDVSEALSVKGRNLAQDQYDWKKIADSMITSIADISDKK